jgi:hypothetical protein
VLSLFQAISQRFNDSQITLETGTWKVYKRIMEAYSSLVF